MTVFQVMQSGGCRLYALHLECGFLQWRASYVHEKDLEVLGHMPGLYRKRSR